MAKIEQTNEHPPLLEISQETEIELAVYNLLDAVHDLHQDIDVLKKRRGITDTQIERYRPQWEAMISES